MGTEAAMSGRRVARLVVALLAALALAAPAAGADPGYVALGDSYAAGPLIPAQLPPFGCLKSSSNYAHLAAPQMRLPLRDPSCSGPKTDHMPTAQGVTPGPNPPQFDSLAADTTLVTVQIG